MFEQVRSLSPLRDLLATAGGDKLVRVFDMAGKATPTKTLKGHTAKVFNVAWHPYFDYILASGSDDSTIRVWDTKTVSPPIR